MSNPQRVELRHGDCIELMRELPDNSIDSIVTDPPYGLEFMGKEWDSFKTGKVEWADEGTDKSHPFRDGSARVEYGIGGSASMGFQAWFTAVATEALRVLKPGGHLLAFGGTRTYHRLTVAIEDAGFEIRDSMIWLYGSGFPKSHDVSKAIDRRGGAQVAWFGPWFRKWREANGIAQKQVAALFPSKSNNLTGCVANWELGFNMPTPEQFNLIRDTFNLPFNSMEEAEREVVGSITHSRSGGEDWAKRPGSIATPRTVDITAPATPAAQQWSGWGTALKPAHEPIVVARKPIIGTVAENVLKWGVGAMNIDGCRIATDDKLQSLDGSFSFAGSGGANETGKTIVKRDAGLGRWPANVVLSHTVFCEQISEGETVVSRVQSEMPDMRGNNFGRANGKLTLETNSYADKPALWNCAEGCPVAELDRQSEGVSRFFYVAKASKRERPKVDGVAHPTVKPLALMRWLVRLVTPPNGTVLEPFAGSGTTVEAALLEGFSVLAFEKTADYLPLIRERIRRTDTGVTN